MRERRLGRGSAPRLIQGHLFTAGHPVAEVADDILAGHIRFTTGANGTERALLSTDSTRVMQLVQTFAALANTLVADYDAVDLPQLSPASRASKAVIPYKGGGYHPSY